MKVTGKRILGILLAICMASVFLAITPMAADGSITLNTFDSIPALQQDLQELIDDEAAQGGTITVVGGKSDATGTLTLAIPEGIKVLWTANLAGSTAIALSGAGSFELAGSAVIETTAAIAISSNGVDIIVNGGSLDAAGTGIAVVNANVSVLSSHVKAGGVAIAIADSDDKTATGNLLISGGRVESAATAIVVTGGKASTSFTMSAGEVIGMAVTEACPAVLSGGTITGSVSIGGNLTLSGSNITGDAVISGGDVALSAGTVTGQLSSLGGKTTVSGGAVIGWIFTETGEVTVTGGSVTSEAIAVVTDSGAVKVSGGAITAAFIGVLTNSGAVTISNGSVATTQVADEDDEETVAVGSVSGTVTVTGGTITGANIAAATESGMIKIIGGTVTGAGSAIEIDDNGVAAYFAGTCTGDMNVVDDAGLIVEVASAVDATILGKLHGTSEGLTVAAGAASAAWDVSGEIPKIVFTLGNDSTQSLEWGKVQSIILSNGIVNRTSDVAATIGFNTNTEGKVYCLVLSGNAAAPAKETFLVGTDLGDVGVGTVNDIDVVLTTGVKSIFVVVVDAAGRISSPLKITAPAYVTKYDVTVNGGTGSGSFAAGAKVRVTAGQAPAGKVFDKWTTEDGVIFEDENAASTTFAMPDKAVAVSAVYKDAPPEVKYIFSTKYESNTCNWLKFFLLFGWIWMWFIAPT